MFESSAVGEYLANGETLAGNAVQTATSGVTALMKTLETSVLDVTLSLLGMVSEAAGSTTEIPRIAAGPRVLLGIFCASYGEANSRGVIRGALVRCWRVRTAAVQSIPPGLADLSPLCQKTCNTASPWMEGSSSERWSWYTRPH